MANEAFIVKCLNELGDLQNLTVMLVDERYGPTGHADSNWHQLQQAGCNFKHMNTVAVLQDPQQTLEATTATYAQKVAAAMAAADVIIAVFGIGEDGHTAGILPGSLASQDTTQLVVGYETQQHKRITLSRQALVLVNEAYVFAFGANKLSALNRLQDHNEAFEQLPATVLYEIPQTYIYNDQLGVVEL